MADYFGLFARVLRPGGMLRNQAIAISATYDFVRGDRFMNRYVFPDAQLMSLHQALGGAEAAGLEVADVEHLRGHYPRTLRAWRERLEAARPAAEGLVGRTAYRVFRLYLAACEVAFEKGAIKLYQTLLRKPGGPAAPPPSRAGGFSPPCARA